MVEEETEEQDEMLVQTRSRSRVAAVSSTDETPLEDDTDQNPSRDEDVISFLED